MIVIIQTSIDPQTGDRVVQAIYHGFRSVEHARKWIDCMEGEWAMDSTTEWTVERSVSFAAMV